MVDELRVNGTRGMLWWGMLCASVCVWSVSSTGQQMMTALDPSSFELRLSAPLTRHVNSSQTNHRVCALYLMTTEAVVSRQISRHCVDALSQVQLRIVIGSVHPITPSVTDWMWFIPPPGLVVVMFSLSVCMSVCQHGKVKSCGQILTKIFGGMWYVTSNSWLNYSYDLVHSADDDF